MPPLYAVDDDALHELAPTVVLTQSLCKVCAISSDAVERAASSPSCDVHSGAPGTLAEVAGSIAAIGEACGVPLRGRAACEQFEAQVCSQPETLNPNPKP